VIAYLDSNALIWLSDGSLAGLSPKIDSLLEKADLLFSQMVLLELEFLYEIKRSKRPARDIQNKVEHELGVRLCDLPFSEIASAALDEKWTRDPFDRLIVANAKANGFAWLISADEAIAAHYPRTVWELPHGMQLGHLARYNSLQKRVSANGHPDTGAGARRGVLHLSAKR
jgi:PIN domain nuclease of toxin-antitoxin system